MCRFKFHLIVALLTFGIGVLGVSLWFVKANAPQPVIKETKQIEPEIYSFNEAKSAKDGSSVTFPQKNIEPEVLQSVPSETVRDERLETAIHSVLEIEEFENPVRYYYNRVDLNGDKKPEVIVFVFGRWMCGSSGCDAFLFQKVSGKYKLVTAFEPARNPIIVSETKTNGWQDLIFYNAGGGIVPGYYSLSQFDGKTYQDNPTIEKDSPPLKTGVKGVAYVVGEYSPEFGLRLRPKK